MTELGTSPFLSRKKGTNLFLSRVIQILL